MFRSTALPKIIDHDRYRNELLSQCFELFARHGYGSLTMRQIASGLGVSTGTLYYYFESKEAIFEQVVWLRIEQGLREIGKQINLDDPIDRKIQSIFEQIGKLQEELFQELVLYVDYYQYQQMGKTEKTQLLINTFQIFQPDIQTTIGITNPHAAQLLFSCIDGLLLARIYDCKIDWQAQGKLMAELMKKYAENQP